MLSLIPLIHRDTTMRKFTFLSLIFAFLLVTSIAAAQDTYTTTRSARVRGEPNTSSEIITTLRSGTAITVLEAVQGESVSDSRVWYRIRNGYVHSSLVRAGGSPSSSPATGNGGNTTLATVEPVPPPAAAWSPVCTGDVYNCGDLTRAQIDAYAVSCVGDPSRLDRDKDGLYCER